jgi:hypothetical protein
MIYYWESKNRGGHYTAGTDADAIAMIPSEARILYKESDAPDGTPFIVVYEKFPLDNTNF